MKFALVALLFASALAYSIDLRNVNLLVAPAKKTQIDNFTDALAHYRSGAGGSVPAKKLITNELMKHKTYTKFLQTLKDKAKTELKQVSVAKTRGTVSYASDKKTYLSSMTLGGYGLSAKYSFSWKATAFKKASNGRMCRTVSTTAPVTVSFDGYDYWDFEPNEGYSGVKNLIREKIPGVIASWRAGGKEKPFTITVNFTDKLGSFTITQCK